MSIGSKIAQYRKEKGLTQETLAQLIGVTNQAVSKWESDQCCPDIQILPKLADIFDVSVDALFDREAVNATTNSSPSEDHHETVPKESAPVTSTFCAKSCSTCPQKEAMGCPGCKIGPGNQINGDCEIARCCRAKGHQTCSTCAQNVHCGQLKSSHRMPEYRRKKQEAAEKERLTLQLRAPFFAKWLTVLFWLFITTELVSLLDNDLVLQYFPILKTPAVAIGLVFAIARAAILLILSKKQYQYRVAGICGIFAGIVQALSAFISSDVAQILLLIASVALTITALYHEYQGHIQALYGVNEILSQKWSDLWRWQAVILALTVGGALSVTLFSLLAALAVLVGSIGSIVVGIIRLVYLYQSAAAFREFSREEADSYSLR